MELPMAAGLQVGNVFPNFALPDQDGEEQKLSQLLRGFPGVLIFSRGHFCPKDHRQMASYVDQLQPELRVNYCKMITVSVDDKYAANEMRNKLNADWPFLLDPERTLLHQLEMVDRTDPIHGEIYIPYTFVLDRTAQSIKFTMDGGLWAAQQSRSCGWIYGP